MPQGTKIGKRLNPVLWAICFFLLAQGLILFAISRVDVFLETNNIYVPAQGPPEIVTLWPTAEATPWTALGPILIYFFAVIVVIGVVLFLVPVSVLRSILRALFTLIFSWGLFVLLILWLPIPVTAIISVATGLVWFLTPRVWLHNLLMIAAMVSLGVVFGRIISPWTAMVLLLVLAVYDLLAVRFGYMMWMARKLSSTDSLPAFVLPWNTSGWKSSLKKLDLMAEEAHAEREYSILGGGDIGFPLLLAAAVYFGYGFSSAVLMAAFMLIGLIAAYGIQSAFLKGRPMPALPPIAALAMMGLLIVQ
ncbi:hypothetical protein ACFLTL_02310 [Chloroflexota bacterium]